MKKRTFRRAVAVFAAAIMCIGGGGEVYGQETRLISVEETVSPNNIAIIFTSNKLTKLDTETVNCYGEDSVDEGYTAGITVELQKKDGKWGTIKTWNNSGGATAAVDEDYTVLEGYSYRLKVTYKAYDGSGKLVESLVDYSNVVP